jgi:Eukaryotic translation initiation factor 4E binding protein (EIF4EBP)
VERVRSTLYASMCFLCSFCCAPIDCTLRYFDSMIHITIFPLRSVSGTKIVYERTFLMNLRNSPLSHTPPKGIPCHLMKGDSSAFHHHNHQNQMNGTYHPPQHNNKPSPQLKEKDKSNGWSKVRRSTDVEEEHQFDMDI